MFPTLLQATGFEKVWGRAGTDVAKTVYQMNDGSIYVFGSSELGTIAGFDFTLNKLDSSGQLLWMKDFGTMSNDLGLAMCFSKNGFVMVGVTENPLTMNTTDILIIRVDSSGHEDWRKTYGGSGNDQCKWISTTPSGGYVLSGFIPDPFGSIDNYVLVIDSIGDKIFDSSFGSSKFEVADGIFYIPGNQYALASTTQAFGNNDLEIQMIDSIGQLVWDTIEADPLENGSQGMYFTSKQRIIAFGETEISQFSAFEFLIVSYDTEGHQKWKSIFGGPGREALFGLTESPDGDLVGTGYANSGVGINLPVNLAITCSDSLGNLKWIQEYGGPLVDGGNSITPALGGGYLAAGYYTGSDQEFYLVRTDPNFTVSLPESIKDDKFEVKLSPNPVNNFGRITANHPIKKLIIKDITSKTVLVDLFENDNLIDFDFSELSPGLYFLQAFDYQDNSTGFKFIIQH